MCYLRNCCKSLSLSGRWVRYPRHSPPSLVANTWMASRINRSVAKYITNKAYPDYSRYWKCSLLLCKLFFHVHKKFTIRHWRSCLNQRKILEPSTDIIHFLFAEHWTFQCFPSCCRTNPQCNYYLAKSHNFNFCPSANNNADTIMRSGIFLFT